MGMSIQEVSEKFQLTKDTLRYYEKVGIIPPVHRNGAGIRDYSEDDVHWVSQAKCLREAGLPVEVLIQYQKLYEAGDHTIPERLDLLVNQKEELEHKLQQITETIQRLNRKIKVYQHAIDHGKLDWSIKEDE